MGLIFWLYLHRVFRGTWSGEESSRFLFGCVTNPDFWASVSLCVLGGFRRCANWTTILNTDAFVGLTKLGEIVMQDIPAWFCWCLIQSPFYQPEMKFVEQVLC